MTIKHIKKFFGEIFGLSKQNYVENHPKKKQIIAALVKQRPYAEISKEYDIPRASLMNYVKKQLPEKIAKEQTKDAKTCTDIYLDKLDEITTRCQKLFDACDEWLQDPVDSKKYCLDPRDSELYVVYSKKKKEEADGTVSYSKERKRELLSKIIERIETDGKMQTYSVHYKIADPRSLILKTADTMRGLLELTAKITGDIKEIQAKADIEHVIVPQIVQSVMICTGQAPEIQKALIERLTGIVDDYHDKIQKAI